MAIKPLSGKQSRDACLLQVLRVLCRILEPAFGYLTIWDHDECA